MPLGWSTTKLLRVVNSHSATWSSWPVRSTSGPPATAQHK